MELTWMASDVPVMAKRLPSDERCQRLCAIGFKEKNSPRSTTPDNKI